MNRIEKKFQELKNKGEKALITYITCGDPKIELTEEFVYAKERAGADIIELGIPFSDPLADGPIIQAAATRALENGIKLKDIFQCVENIRKNSQVPLVFMVYYNTVVNYGELRFVEKCEEIGIDGIIIPDLPYEESVELRAHLKSKELALIPLIAPNSGNRIEKLVEDAKGFIYCVSSLGVTGVRNEFAKTMKDYLKSVKDSTDVPVAVGFGFSKPEDLETVKDVVDGVIVGSAIIKCVDETSQDIASLENLVSKLKNAL